jgi:hypothetical protein
LGGCKPLDDGVNVVTEKTQASKKIKVKTLNGSTNVAALATEIVVERCRLTLCNPS